MGRMDRRRAAFFLLFQRKKEGSLWQVFWGFR